MSELTRWILLAFFVSHIPASLIVDGQAVIPSRLYPQFAKDALAWHCKNSGDPTMCHGRNGFPAWIRGLIAFEMIYDVPFFFFGIYALYKKRNWIRAPGILYGAHTVAALAPIMLEIYESKKISESQRTMLLSMYAPYMIIPAAALVWFMGGDPFPEEKASAAAGKKRA